MIKLRNFQFRINSVNRFLQTKDLGRSMVIEMTRTVLQDK